MSGEISRRDSRSDPSLFQTWQWCAAQGSRFLHAPVDARRFALVRIGYALLILIYLAVLYPDLETWYGPLGVYPAEVDAETKLPQLWSVLRWLPADPYDAGLQLHRYFWLHVVCTVFLLFGFATRVNAILGFVLLVSWQNRNPLILDGEDSVFRLIGFYLMLMPSGRACSVDRWLSRCFTPPESRDVCPLTPAWSLRLVQLQMTVIFIAAALFKLGGSAWLDGTALSYVVRLDDTFGRFPLPSLLFQIPLLVRLMTWTVIAVELIAPLLLWFRETRRWALLAIVLFHLSNEYAMCLFLFHWIMLVGWSTFLTSDDLSRLPGCGDCCKAGK